MTWLNSKQIKKQFGICNQTLYNWRKENKIIFKKINDRNFLYDIDSILNTKNEKRENVIYCRVSNTKQNQDLIKQEQIIKEYMVINGIKVDKVYKEIASGMNENRKEFNNLISDVQDNKIDKIFITYKDRLTRFGFSYFENFFKKYNTEIVVLNATDETNFEQELTEDLISIIHHFSMKMYSNRRKKLKEIEEQLKNENNKDSN